MTKNEKALLDTIGFSEIGRTLLAKSDNGYNVLLGGALFSGYLEHPRKLITVNGLTSTAAGRYQILERYFDAYKAQLHLMDFSPHSQDMIALQMIKEVGADKLINEGHFEDAINKCSTRWASLPGAKYGQHVNDMAHLKAFYENVGGLVT